MKIKMKQPFLASHDKTRNNAFWPLNIQPQARAEKLLIQESKDEILVYDLNTDQVFCLNPMAAAVWSQCDGQKNINQISAILKSEKGIDSNEELIWLTLHELDKSNLLVKTQELAEVNNRINRRESIKRLALGTTFLLPVISSLVTPLAVQSASVCNLPPCTQIGDACCNDSSINPVGVCLQISPTVPLVCSKPCVPPTVGLCSPATIGENCCTAFGNGVCVEVAPGSVICVP